MRLRTVLLGVVTTAVIASFAWVGAIHAQTFRTGSDVTVSSNEPIDSTLFAAGSNIDIASDVNGDVFCAGQSITITGKVSGDVICAGQSITISGAVAGSVRLAGQTVLIDSVISKNATIAGQTVALRSSGKIGGDLSAASASTTVNGTVGRDAALAGQSVTLTSSIGRDVKGTIENLTLANGAHIGGSIDYTSSKDLKKDTNARVGGKITRSEPKREEPKRRSALAFNVGWFIYSLLSLLFLTFILTLAIPQRMHQAAAINIRSSWRPLLVGFVASLIIPAIIIAFMITIIGMPVALLLGLLWLIILFVSIPVTAYYIGHMVLQGYEYPLVIALTGAAILALLIFIPLLGSLVFLLALWLGSGLVLMALRGHWRQPVYNLKALPSADGEAK